MTKRIFISHISEESKLAQALKSAIEGDFLGMARVFVSSDTTSINAGDQWLQTITDEITQSAILIVLCSHASIARPWINFESGAAWIQRVTIIPLCHGDLALNDLPPPLAYLQAAIVGEAGIERVYQRIAKALKVNMPDRDFSQLGKQFAAIAELIQTDRRLAEAKRNGSSDNIRQQVSRKNAGILIEADPKLHAKLMQGHAPKEWGLRFNYVGLDGAKAWIDVPARGGYETDADRQRIRRAVGKVLEQERVSTFVSLGPGDAVLDAYIAVDLTTAKSELRYVPVDISDGLLRVAAERLSDTCPVPIAILCDFEEHVDFVQACLLEKRVEGPRLYGLLGNTLGNVDSDETRFLSRLSRIMRKEDLALIGVVVHVDGLVPALSDVPGGLLDFVMHGVAKRIDKMPSDCAGSESEHIQLEEVAAFATVPGSQALVFSLKKNRLRVATFRRYRDIELRAWLTKSVRFEVVAYEVLGGNGSLRDAVYLLRRA